MLDFPLCFFVLGLSFLQVYIGKVHPQKKYTEINLVAFFYTCVCLATQRFTNKYRRVFWLHYVHIFFATCVHFCNGIPLGTCVVVT